MSLLSRHPLVGTKELFGHKFLISEHCLVMECNEFLNELFKTCVTSFK